MIPAASLLSIAALGLLQEATPPSEKAWWDLGLLARSVESREILAENRFGGGWGWFAPFTTEVEWIDSGLVVRSKFVIEGVSESIVLELTRVGARAQMARYSCVSHEPIREAAGVVCLFTDGVTAALDFEVFLTNSDFGFSGMYGHIHLGSVGVGLANELLLWPIAAEASPFESRRVLTLAEGNESSGWVDVFGRRQGVWTLRDANGCKRTETTWSNGRPHGRSALWDESGQLSGEMHHRDGLWHGECSSWHEGGELRSIEHFVDDVPCGLRVEFDPSGAKVSESVLSAGAGPSAGFLRDLARLRTRE